jgi:predicted phosphoribosyltransferase
MFRDRADAGEQLADRLASEGVDADLVLGIPRGALPVARPVADRLGAPLDIVAAKKLGMPGNPEFAIGAVAADGSSWINDAVIQRHDVGGSYVEEERQRAAETAEEKIQRYRQGRPAPKLQGQTVVLVDDGVATGATARACLRQLRNAGAERVILAVPVGPPDSIEELRREADEVIVLETPGHFQAVGGHYERFGQVSDDEAMEYLGWN